MSYERMLRYASNYLFEATEGYSLIWSAEITDDTMNSGYNVLAGNWIAEGNFLPYTEDDFSYINMPYQMRFKVIDVPYTTDPDFYRDIYENSPWWGNHWSTLVHEIGHMIFRLGDEADRANGVKIFSGFEIHSVMSYDWCYHEFSTLMDYSDPGDHVTDTEQSAMNNGRSCWEMIFSRFNYFSGAEGTVMFDLDRNGYIDVAYPSTFVPINMESVLLFEDWAFNSNLLISNISINNT